MKPLEIKIMPVNNTVSIPSYGSVGASGLDLHAFLEQDIVIEPSNRKIIPTGISIALPPGLEGQIRPRSGLALHHGITVLNTPATIDSDYRGELKVLLINFGDQAFTVEPGMRIGQLVVASVSKVNFKVSASLSKTDRGELGFGSTGLH